MTYGFTKHAFRMLSKLPRDISRRILEKLDWYIAQDDPLTYAEPLTDYVLGEYRFRIGDYRVVFDVDNDGDILILLVGNRRDVYR